MAGSTSEAATEVEEVATEEVAVTEAVASELAATEVAVSWVAAALEEVPAHVASLSAPIPPFARLLPSHRAILTLHIHPSPVPFDDLFRHLRSTLLANARRVPAQAAQRRRRDPSLCLQALP